MKIINKINRPALGHRDYENEDVIGSSRHGAWVIDGVSRISMVEMKSKQSNQSRWFALELHKALETNIDDFSQSISDILRQVVMESETSFQKIATSLVDGNPKIPKHAWPAASVVVIRDVGNSLEWFVIGDCIAYVETTAQSIVIEHHQSRHIQDSLKEELARKLERNKDMPFELVRKEIIEPMLKRNQERNPNLIPDSLQLYPESVNLGLTGSIQTSNGARTLLMSDGYARAVDNYLLFKSYHELMAESFKKGPESILERIRKIEKQDRECRKYLRLKQSDDASAILIKHEQITKPLTRRESARLRMYAQKLQQAEPFTMEEARDMQELATRAQKQSRSTESLWLAGLLGVAAGVAIGVLGKMLYDSIIGLTKEDPEETE